MYQTIFSMDCVVCGIAFVIITLNAYRERRLIKTLSTKGVSTSAYIVSIDSEKGPSYRIKYIFRIDGNEYAGEQFISIIKAGKLLSSSPKQNNDMPSQKRKNDDFERTPLKVTYLESNPEISRLLDSIDNETLRVRILLLAFAFAIMTTVQYLLIK